MASIQELSSQLKLSYIRDNADTLIAEARQTRQDYAEFLEGLLLREAERRTENGITRRIKDARSPIKKYLVDFDRSKYDKAFAAEFKELETLAFEHWESLFQDPVLTGAIIDRLAHKAHVLDISRDQGGRFEETLALLANKPKNKADTV